MSTHSTTHSTIRIHYNPPEGATLGIRCGGEGNDWQKFYYATKKGNTWVCSIPMVKSTGSTEVEFKPVLQYNAPVPTVAPQRKVSFSSPDLRKNFLSSSSSAYLKSHTNLEKAASNERRGSAALAKQMVNSPLRPSAYSVEGERDENYAIGANYLVNAGDTIDVYPWFYTYNGKVEVLEKVDILNNIHILKDKRDVIVYLPPSYFENPQKKYPVMIMHDAHNLFFEEISFCGRVWKIPFTMDELSISGVIKETIIVAITPIKREYEYLPPTPGGRSDGGGAELYLDFIGKELKPMISSKYRITGEYGIAGSSYGGIISLYAWLTRPQEYSLCGCYSPSLKWHNNYMISVAQKAIKQNLSDTHKNHLMYLDAGTDSDQVLATAKLARKIEKAFNQEQIPKETIEPSDDKPRALEVLEKVVAVTGTSDQFGGIRHVSPVQTFGAVLKSGQVGHNHSEDSWAKRTPFAFTYLLRDTQREIKWVKEVVEDISYRVTQ